MKEIKASDLKTILHSKRANLYYLEHCRVLVNGGVVEYVTEEEQRSLYWNIPLANTTTILLGTGTSVTNAAMREFARAGVMVGFSGGGGTPLFSGTEREIDILWMPPQSEYRATEYMQAWCSFWFKPEARLWAAKQFQKARMERVRREWPGPHLKKEGFAPDADWLAGCLEDSAERMLAAPDVGALLLEEARLTKKLFAMAADAVSYPDFSRAKRGSGQDSANRFLDHGNYLAYGLGATAAWVLGLPQGLAVLHGKTRRGALVFDIADLVKDSCVLPRAFLAAAQGYSSSEFRRELAAALVASEALDFMIDNLKEVALSAAARFGGLEKENG